MTPHQPRLLVMPRLRVFLSFVVLAGTFALLSVATASAAKPTVTIAPADEIGFQSAHVSGTIDPSTSEAQYFFQLATEAEFSAPGFEWGETDEQGFGSVASGSGPTPVEAIVGVEGGTTYHLRLVATNGEGTEATVASSTFTTRAGAQKPTVTAATISGVTATTATVTFEVDPNSPEPAASTSPVEKREFETTYFVSCENNACQEKQGTLAADDIPHQVSLELIGLKPGRQYDVHFGALDAIGFTEGSPPVAFTAHAAAPTILSTFVTHVTSTEAELDGIIEPEGAPTSYRFEYTTAAEFASHGFNGATAVPAREGQATPAVGTGQIRQEEHLAQFGGNNGTVMTGVHASSGSFLAGEHATISYPPGSGLPPSSPLPISIVRGDQLIFGSSFQDEFEGEVELDTDPTTSAVAHLEGLASGTTYDYRIVATNSASGPGGVVGPVRRLTTDRVEQGASGCPNEQLRGENGSLALPDCRAYELVSPPAGARDVLVPVSQLASVLAFEHSVADVFRAAPGGERVAYVGQAAPSGGADEENQFLAERSPAGWSSVNITPSAFGGASGAGDAYLALSSDLSQAIASVSASTAPLAPSAPSPCAMLYVHSGSEPEAGYDPLYPSQGEAALDKSCGSPLFAGANAGTEAIPDFSRMAFQDEVPLIPGALETAGGGAHGCSERCDLYLESSGRLDQVNLLPGGAQAPATYGAPPIEAEDPPNLDSVISADGSRVFWTDIETGVVYMRENPDQNQSLLDGTGACIEATKACTVPVSTGPARYWTATPDGRFVYYTESGQLWRFDADAPAGSQRQALTPAGAGVKGVIGTNEEGEDGAYLYFVAEAGLPGTDAEGRVCEPTSRLEAEELRNREEAELKRHGRLPVGIGCNLYVLQNGQASLASVLSWRDDRYKSPRTPHPQVVGDWRAEVGGRTAAVSADGRSVVFRSLLPLTPEGSDVPPGSEPAVEIFDFHAPDAALSCISCSPSGELLVPEDSSESSETRLAISESVSFAAHSMSPDGSRVFFDTRQALLPQDTDASDCPLFAGSCTGDDVYEWERQGTGACNGGSPANGDGCLYLISPGTRNESYLVEADPEGKNVFFVTAAVLTPGTGDARSKLYDAREGGGFPAPSGATCERDGCRDAPLGAPPTTSPGTSSFQADERSPSGCRKGTSRRHGRCVARKHHPRRTRHGHRRRRHRHQAAGYRRPGGRGGTS